MKKTTNHFMLLLLFCISGLLAFGQAKRTVSGTVKDSTGAILTGVSVIIKGTKTGGSTDFQGNFQINVPLSEKTLVFSSTGFQNKEIAITGNEFVNVVLINEPGQINDVVVTGFGLKKSTRKISYSVTQISGDEITRTASPTLVNALQGKVAGVMINQGAGGPQSTSRIRIRGNSNISSNNTMPLFVIDGVLIKPGAPGSDGYGNGTPRDFGNELTNLNPDDYESLTVLKGSAATALYGSDALSGVVLITTKKGHSRKGVGVNVSQTNTIDDPYKGYDWQNEYGGGIDPVFSGKDAQGYDIIDANNGPYYSFGPKLDGHIVHDADGVLRPFKANDILNTFFKKGNYSNTSVSIDGGTDRSSFRVSYTNTNNKGISPNNTFRRDAVNLRATQKVSNFLNIDAGIAYTNTSSQNPLFQGGSNLNPIFRMSYSNSRNTPLDYLLNNYVDSANGGVKAAAPYVRSGNTAMLWQLYQNRYTQKQDNLRANIDLNFTILPWLNFLVRANINNTNTFSENKLRGMSAGFLGSSAQYSFTQNNQKQGRAQALLTATHKLSKDLEGSFTIGGESNRGLGGVITNGSTSGGFKRADYYNVGNSVNSPTLTAVPYNNTRLDALYTYGDLTWKSMLTLNFSARNDWNSNLTYPDGHGDFSYFYPSVGLAWVFTELLNNKPQYNFLSYGKLRASFGYVGSSPSQYSTSTGMGYTSGGNTTGGNGTSIPLDAFGSYALGNLSLKPQMARELEFGTELKFLNNRIGIDVAVYKKNTFNEVITLQHPPESGVNSSIINAGNLQNKGIEILLTGTPIKSKNFQWDISLNFARNKNLVLNLDSSHGQNSFNLAYAWGSDVRSVAATGKEFGDIETGFAYAHYQDKTSSVYGQKLLNSSGLYYRAQDIGQGTSVSLGSMMEKYTYGISNTFRYKDFNLFVQIDSKMGGKMASGTHQYGSEYGAFKSTLFGRDATHGGVTFNDGTITRSDGIIPDGVFAPGTLFNGVDYGGKTYAAAVSAGVVKPLTAATYYDGVASWGTGIREYSVFEDSWVSLREVSVGYNLPKTITSKIKFNTIRVSLIGRNLMYLYNSTPDHFNPESLYGSQAGTFAEYGGNPFVRNYGISVNAGF